MTLVYPAFGILLALRLSQNNQSLFRWSSGPLTPPEPRPFWPCSLVFLATPASGVATPCHSSGGLWTSLPTTLPYCFPLLLFNKPQIPFLIWCLSLGCKLNWYRDFFFFIYSQCPEPCLAYNRYFIEISLNSNQFMNI